MFEISVRLFKGLVIINARDRVEGIQMGHENFQEHNVGS